MPAYFAGFAQEDMPNIEYSGVNHEMAKWALRAVPRLAGYEVTIMPVDTPEEALATAQERAAHLQAEGEADARAQGAVFIVSSRKEDTSEEVAKKLHRERASSLLLRVRMPPGASSYELLRDYYSSELGPEPTRD